MYSAAGKALWNSGTIDKSAPIPPLVAGDGGLLPDGGLAPGGSGSENGAGPSAGDADAGDGGCAMARSSRAQDLFGALFTIAALVAASKRRRRV